MIDAAPERPSSLHSEIVYRILVGETAGKRGRVDIALAHYLAAAMVSEDPRIAERAVSIGLFLENDQSTLEAARRWYALAPENPQSRQVLATVLLRNGRMEEAVEHLDAIRARSTHDGQDGYASVSFILDQIEDKETALKVMAALRSRHPDSVDGMLHFAIAASEVGAHGPALEALDEVLSRRPGHARAHLLRAGVLIEQERPNQALSELEAAVAALPEDRTLRDGYARLLVQAEQYDKAREQFETLVEEGPDDGDALYTLGLLASQAEDYDAAVAYLTRVIELGHRVSESRFELGRIEERRENYRAAAGHYEKVGSGERYFTAQVRLGVVMAQLGDLDRMRLHYATQRRDYPQDATVFYLAEADVLREAGREQESFDLLSEALEHYPEDEDLRYSRALAAERIDRLDVLESDLRRLIEADPENGHALNALGYTLADRTDRYQEALGYLQRAIVLLPDDAAVLDSMGWVKYRLGSYQESLDYLRRAYALSQDAEIAAHLAEVLWVSGQKEEARSLWADAIAEDPDDAHLLRVKERFDL